jgi:HK97 family phage prohead protease
MPTVSDRREYLDIKEAAELLGLHSSTLYRAAAEGRLPVVRLGNRGAIRIRRRDLEPKAEVVRAVAPWHLKVEPHKPSWYFGSFEDYIEQQEQRRFITKELEPVRFQQTLAGDVGQIAGIAMPYRSWAEIRSPSEGHFMEQFASGAFANQLREGIRSVKVLFDHGTDLLGRQVIAKLLELRDRPDALYYRAELLRGLPELIVAGLAAGTYGSSVRFKPVEVLRNQFPARSEHNPKGLPEHVVTEARLAEVSVTPFPAYRDATAEVVTATA